VKFLCHCERSEATSSKFDNTLSIVERIRRTQYRRSRESRNLVESFGVPMQEQSKFTTDETEKTD